MLYEGRVYDKDCSSLIDDKIPLLAFSGGFDSMRVLQLLLKRYVRVDLLYVFIGHRDGKTMRELDVLAHVVTAHSESNHGEKGEIISGRIRMVHYREGPMIGEFHGQRNHQDLSLFTAAIAVFNPDIHDALYVGWNGSDDFGCDIPTDVACWQAMCRSYFPRDDLDISKVIAMPLLNRRKYEVIASGEFHKNIRTYLPWTCELPRIVHADDPERPACYTNVLPCGECRPCLDSQHAALIADKDYVFQNTLDHYRDSPLSSVRMLAVLEQLGLGSLIMAIVTSKPSDQSIMNKLLAGNVNGCLNI